MKSRGNTTSGLTPGLIEEYKNKINPVTGKPYNQNEIAELFGVSRQAVSQMKRRYGGFSMTPRELAMMHYPWKVPSSLQGSAVDKGFRAHFEWMATSGKGMSQRNKELARALYNKLGRDRVLEFNPNLPAIPGASYGGYRFVRRVESDGDLIVRVNEWTNLTPEGRALCRFPPIRP